MDLILIHDNPTDIGPEDCQINENEGLMEFHIKNESMLVEKT